MTKQNRLDGLINVRLGSGLGVETMCYLPLSLWLPSSTCCFKESFICTGNHRGKEELSDLS